MEAGENLFKARQDPVPTGLNCFGPGPNAPQNQKRQTRIPSPSTTFPLTLLVCSPSSSLMAPLTRSAASVGATTHRSQVSLTLVCDALLRQLANVLLMFSRRPRNRKSLTSMKTMTRDPSMRTRSMRMKRS